METLQLIKDFLLPLLVIGIVFWEAWKKRKRREYEERISIAAFELKKNIEKDWSVLWRGEPLGINVELEDRLKIEPVFEYDELEIGEPGQIIKAVPISGHLEKNITNEAKEIS